jgi:hypothetical protein
MRSDEGRYPKRVGSLFGDKPTSSFFDTLWYKVKNFSSGEVLPEVRKRRRT